MAKYLIYHNPKCSKSRQALKLLEEKGLDYEVKEYLQEGLSQKELKELINKGDFEIKELVRPKEAKEEDVDKNSPTNELIKAIAANPRVLQRPIVTTKAKAVIARDEDWLTRLS